MVLILRTPASSGVDTTYRIWERTRGLDTCGNDGDKKRSDIRDLLLEPSPKLSSKLRVVAARLANARPWDEVLQHEKSVSLVVGEEDGCDYLAIEIRGLRRCTSPQLGECPLRGRVQQQAHQELDERT